MASSSSSASSSGVPPGFRFHPTDEELLLYYLKKKVCFEKFDLEVIREVDLNKTEPWDLQERCRIGATPQNEWYFFSHKDRKYPTGSRTNRATSAGFWKATGRDKCIRTTCNKIGMRKTLVFYRGRAPHGLKTDWIMHEYRLEDTDDPQADSTEDGWVVCRVFKKKCFLKIAGDPNSTKSADGMLNPAAAQYLSQQQSLHLHHQPYSFALHYPQLTPAASSHYPQVQVHDLLSNHRPVSGYHDFSVLLNECEPLQEVGEGRVHQPANEWVLMENLDERFVASAGVGAGAGGSAGVQQMNEMGQQRGGEMDLWGYGK